MLGYCARIYTALSDVYYLKLKMANAQRTENDRITTYRRAIADRATRDTRIKNDEQTIERREKADKALDEHRLKNDQMTLERRKVNDRNPWRTLAISLLILAALAVGTYYLLFLR